MGWYLDQERVTQAAAHLIRSSGGNRMPYLKLLKLLYWADRESIREIGVPLTGDNAVAMKNGPVLSEIYDYIKGDLLIGHDTWDRFLQTEDYEVRLIDDPGTDKLSKFDRRILEAAVAEHAGHDGFDLSELSHEFPEWLEANQQRELDGRGAEPIDLRRTMEAVGCSRAEIEKMEQNREEERQYFQFFEGVTDEAHRPAG